MGGWFVKLCREKRLRGLVIVIEIVISLHHGELQKEPVVWRVNQFSKSLPLKPGIRAKKSTKPVETKWKRVNN